MLTVLPTLHRLRIILRLLLELLLVSQRRAGLADCSESDAALTGSVVVCALAAELLAVAAIASFPVQVLGHGRSALDRRGCE